MMLLAKTQQQSLTSKKTPWQGFLLYAWGIKIRSKSSASRRSFICFQEGKVWIIKTEESHTVSSTLGTAKTCCMLRVCFQEENGKERGGGQEGLQRACQVMIINQPDRGKILSWDIMPGSTPHMYMMSSTELLTQHPAPSPYPPPHTHTRESVEE